MLVPKSFQVEQPNVRVTLHWHCCEQIIGQHADTLALHTWRDNPESPLRTSGVNDGPSIRVTSNQTVAAVVLFVDLASHKGVHTVPMAPPLRFNEKFVRLVKIELATVEEAEAMALGKVIRDNVVVAHLLVLLNQRLLFLREAFAA